MDAATIEREAIALPIAERAVLADRLLQTLQLEDSARMEAWGHEADRRLDAFEKGGTREVDGPASVAAIRRRIA
jgi:hypothetical protein